MNLVNWRRFLFPRAKRGLHGSDCISGTHGLLPSHDLSKKSLYGNTVKHSGDRVDVHVNQRRAWDPG